MRRPPINRVAAEVVNAQRILPSQHLPGTDRFQDAHLVRREALRVEFSLGFDLGFGLGVGESGGCLDAVGEFGRLHFFQDFVLFLLVMVFKCVEAEVDGVRDLVLTELTAYIGCSLDD